MENMSPATAQALAQGLNASASRNPGFLFQLISNMNADTGAAVGQGINALAVGGAASPLYLLLYQTQKHTVQTMAVAMESNLAFLDQMLESLDNSVLGPAINAGIDAAPAFFLRELLAEIDADMLNDVLDGAGMDLVEALLGENPAPPLLDASYVAQALNGGAQHLLEGLMAGLDGQALAESLSDHGSQLCEDLILGLEAQKIADITNAAIAEYPDGMWRNLGIGIFMKTTYKDPIFGLLIHLNVWVNGFLKHVEVGPMPGS
jgi:hypothetical protein